MRISVPWHLSEMQSVHHAKIESFTVVLKALQYAEATLVHDVIISGAGEYEALSLFKKHNTDMMLTINDYLTTLTDNPDNIRNIQDLIDFTKSFPREEFPQLDVEGFKRAVATDSGNALYHDMLANDAHFKGEGGIPNAITRQRCDVLLLPSLSITLQTFATKAGSPVMSIPVGQYSPGTEVEKDAKNGSINALGIL